MVLNPENNIIGERPHSLAPKRCRMLQRRCRTGGQSSHNYSSERGSFRRESIPEPHSRRGQFAAGCKRSARERLRSWQRSQIQRFRRLGWCRRMPAHLLGACRNSRPLDLPQSNPCKSTFRSCSRLCTRTIQSPVTNAERFKHLTAVN